MEILYGCVIFIWAIVFIYIHPHRKAIHKVYELDEQLYVMDVQSVKMDCMLRGEAVSCTIPTFNDYQWDLIDEENRQIRKICLIGVVCSLGYLLMVHGAISLMINDFHKYM